MVRGVSVFSWALLLVAHASASLLLPTGRRAHTRCGVAETLRIDGRLDEEFYTINPPASDFIQVEPEEGAPATEKTEVWIAFDNVNIYISFRCWESQPERVSATEMRRDVGNMWRGDDMVYWMFDTFLDRRNGFEFGLNPIGGRQDAQMANERQWIGDWNTIWEFSTGRFERDGFRSIDSVQALRYGPGETQVWASTRFGRTGGRTPLVPAPTRGARTGRIHLAPGGGTCRLSCPPLENLEIKP